MPTWGTKPTISRQEPGLICQLGNQAHFVFSEILEDVNAIAMRRKKIFESHSITHFALILYRYSVALLEGYLDAFYVR